MELEGGEHEQEHQDPTNSLLNIYQQATLELGELKGTIVRGLGTPYFAMAVEVHFTWHPVF